MFKKLFQKKNGVCKSSCVIPDDYDSEGVTQSLCATELNIYNDVVLCPEQIVQAEGVLAISYTALGTRKCQQDAVRMGYTDEMFAGVLCDGMGGLAGGERASALAADGMLHSLLNADIRDYQQMSQTAIKLNDMVRELCDEQNQRIEAGTTLTTVVVERGQLSWCSIGDSRIYIWREGYLRQLSEDHNLKTRLDGLISAGMISQQAASQYPKQEALTSYLGISELVEICGGRIPLVLKPGDVILQCSDGLYRCLPDEAISAALAGEPDLQQAASRLMSGALGVLGPHDNTSLILTRYTG